MKYHTTDIPVVTPYEGFQILRGEKIPGGLKRPVLERVLCQIEEDTIVYPWDGYGSAGEALALACQATRKKLHLLLPDVGWPRSETFERTTQHKNVTTKIVENTQQQIDLILPAKRWAEANNAHEMPIGCQGIDFELTMAGYLRQIWEENQLPHDAEVWYAGGSGTLGRVLKKTFPSIKLGVMDLGFPQLCLDSYPFLLCKISDTQEEPPPFAVNPDYDGKMWPRVQQMASPGAVIINYAS